jgi:rSAM/selenodomain-associated transferase 2
VLSIIIPTLDAAATLEATLAALGEAPGETEVVVVDGASGDASRDLALGHGARLTQATGGRGAQLAAGAAMARGDWLLFVHADTVLGPGWGAAAAQFMADPANERRAAHFRYRLDDAAAAARRLERMVAWRVRRLGLPYGDQGLLIGHRFYTALGGFAPLPLMEDVELARRIGGRRLVGLDADAVTSAARYRHGGYVLRPLRNVLCLGLYFLGIPLTLVRRLYA